MKFFHFFKVNALLEGGSTQPGRNLKSSHVRNRFRKSCTACGLKTPSSVYPNKHDHLILHFRNRPQLLRPKSSTCTSLAIKGLQVHDVQMHRDAMLLGEVWLSFRRRGRGSLLHPCVQSPESKALPLELHSPRTALDTPLGFLGNQRLWYGILCSYM